MLKGLLPNNGLATAKLDASGALITTGIPLPEALNFYGSVFGRVGRVLRIIGKRSGWTSTSVMGDVAEHLGTAEQSLAPAVLGTTYYLISSSVNDTALGSGMRTVRVIGLDALGDRVAVDYALNGTTAVSIGNTWSFLQRIEGVTGGQAQGTIYLGSVAGTPTVAQTQHIISAGGGKSLSAIYKVPRGHTAWITSWSLGTVNADMDTRLRATVSSNTRALAEAFIYQDALYLALNTNVAEKAVPWFKCPAGSIVKVSSIPSSASANARLNCSFDVVELEDAVTV
jgi:hypothetical protein